MRYIGPGTERPINRDITSIIVPWIIAVVAPPKVWPSMISVLEIGATRVSFKNPNC